MKTIQKTEIELDLSDLTHAIREFAGNSGFSFPTGKLKFEPIFKRVPITSPYPSDCDYRNEFIGLKIRAED